MFSCCHFHVTPLSQLPFSFSTDTTLHEFASFLFSSWPYVRLLSFYLWHHVILHWWINVKLKDDDTMGSLLLLCCLFYVVSMVYVKYMYNSAYTCNCGMYRWYNLCVGVHCWLLLAWCVVDWLLSMMCFCRCYKIMDIFVSMYNIPLYHYTLPEDLHAATF